jgi:hypothetical protein
MGWLRGTLSGGYFDLEHGRVFIKANKNEPNK